MADSWLGEQPYLHRSQPIEAAIQEQLMRLKRSRFAEECAKLHPAEERALAEEALAADIADWAEY